MALHRQVAAAKSVAEASIVQLRVALKDARRATIARATALADALGVNPPKSLLSRRVPNEHRDRLAVRDVTAGGCTYCSSPSSGGARPRSTAVEGGRGGSAGARPGAPYREGTSTDSVGRGCPDRADNALKCAEDKPGSTCRSGAPKPTVSHGSTQAQPVTATRARAENRGSRPLSPPSSGDAGLGWNREWCRSVDAWCRNASARFRSRQAGKVVRSARRLHWLAGSGRDSISCKGEGAAGARRRVSWPPTPSETVGAEGWAALAAFGDVANLLEIVASTAELVVSVSVDQGLTGQEEAFHQKTNMQHPNTLGQEAKEGLEPSPQDEGFVSGGGDFSSERGDETSKCDSTDVAVSLGNTSSTDKKVTLAEGGPADRRERKHGGGRTGSGAADQGKGGVSRSSDTVRKHFSDPTMTQTATRQEPSGGLGEVTRIDRAIAPTKADRRPVSSSSALVPVSEEGDTDMESSSEDGDGGEEGGGDTEARKELSPESSISAAGTCGTFVAGGTEGEAAGDKPDGGADVRELSEKNNPPEKTRSTARIILGPETIAQSLIGISPLSAFVLQAARRSQQRDLEPPDDAREGSLPVASATGAPSSPGGKRENVSNKYRNTRFDGTPGVDNEESLVSNGAVTSDCRSGLTTGGGSLPKLSSGSRAASTSNKNCIIISDTEKTGLASTVETLILPRIRITSTSKRNKTNTATGKRPVIRLRLEDATVGKSKSGSTAAGTVAASAALASEVGLPLAEVAAAAEADAEALEAKVACARRYMENPIHRWVGRVGGRRCLLSCSAALQDCASPPVSTRFEGLSPGRRGESRSHKGRPGEKARYVYAMFVPKFSVERDDVGCRPPSEHRQKQRFVVAGRVPLAGIPSKPGSSGSTDFDSHTRSAPVGFALGRPLCRNCGRRAFQRLLLSTDLLTRSEACSPLYRSTTNKKHGSRDRRLPEDKGSRHAEVNVDRFAPEQVRLELQRGGRLADWKCSSGAMLCASCLGTLRSAEAPLGRVAGR